MNNEIWKDIENYEGLYQVSNTGKVKSHNKKVYNGVGYYFKKGENKKLNLKPNGYLQTILYKNNKYKHKYVQHLVWNQFGKPAKYDKDLYDVDHIDNDQTNNHIDNLQLLTHRENCIKDKTNKSSKYPGVSYVKHNSKYVVALKIKAISYFLGEYNNEEIAAKVYTTAIKYINRLDFKTKIMPKIKLHYKKLDNGEINIK